MRKLVSPLLILLVGAFIHLDWHFARPTHHRLSLGWGAHWLLAVVVFCAAGFYIARRWPNARWRAAAWNVGLGVLLGQGLEPLGEMAFYDHRFAFPDDPGRWQVFFECMAAGIPSLILALVLFRRRSAVTA